MVWASCMAGSLKGRMKNEYDFSKAGLVRKCRKSSNLLGVSWHSFFGRKMRGV